MSYLQTRISAVLGWLFLLTKHRHLSGLCDEYRSNRQQKSGEGSSVDSLPTKTMYILNAVLYLVFPVPFLDLQLREWFQ
jgi:hypothetical protein